jgi:uncharacterized membrane protein (DUF2068 family)
MEIYELVRRVTAVRIAILLLNVAIVAYLVRRVSRRVAAHHHQGA